MLIRIPRKSDPKPSEITPESVYLDRRKFMGAGAALVASAAGLVGRPSRLFAGPRGEATSPGIEDERPAPQELGPFTWGEDLRDELTPYEDVTTYNNFYEFGTAKEDPSRHAPGLFEPEPWTVAVDGHVENTGTFDVEELLPRSEWEERIYRLRCVEAWSMVIPWVGVPLRNVISRLEPTSRARYVRFETVVRPEQMPGQRRSILDWPYVEGLRMDEATNQLAFLSTGLYGKELPVQNGAPLRLVVPWKYGFKSIKSIVRISFVEEMPLNTWKQQASNEYGFFANVNPEVDHPRWSQARERRIGEFRRRETMMFNGYGEEVAHMYRGMDLSRWY